MRECDLAQFLSAVNLVRNIAGVMRSPQQPFVAMPQSTYEQLVCAAETLVEETSKFGFAASLATARRLLKTVKTGATPHDVEVLGESSVKFVNFHMLQFCLAADEIDSRVLDEFSIIKTIILSTSEANYFGHGDIPFGSDVAESFPGASYDIEEASKSLAFGRYTACIFHLMRAMEHSLSVVGAKIGATIIDKNGSSLPWGIINSNIKGEIDKMPRGEVQDEWLKVHALLHSVNRAWRVQVAHPKSSYTLSEAENAWDAVRAFMSHLSSLN